MNFSKSVSFFDEQQTNMPTLAIVHNVCTHENNQAKKSSELHVTTHTVRTSHGTQRLCNSSCCHLRHSKVIAASSTLLVGQ